MLPKGAGRDPAVGRHRRREGLRAVGHLRHGQVRSARAGAVDGARASPKGIHVAHFVIDGGIRSAARPGAGDNPDSLLDPDAIAETYWATMQQHRSAWSWEVEVRPWVEKF